MGSRKKQILLLLVLIVSIFFVTCALVKTGKKPSFNDIGIDVTVDINTPTQLRADLSGLNCIDTEVDETDRVQEVESPEVEVLESEVEIKENEETIIKVIENEPTYLFTDIEDKKQYANTSVNLRLGPGEEFDSAHQVKLNTELLVTHEIDNGWSVVNYEGINYYCSTKLLQNEKVYVAPPYNESTGAMKFDGNVSQACRNKAISLYNKIPSNMINAIKADGYTIIVSTNSYYTDGHCGTYYPKGWDWGARTNKICVYAKSVNAVNISVIHECGHWLDDYLGTKEGWGRTGYYGYTGVTSDPTWVAIYNEEVGRSGYPSWANYCPEEYFAESVWKALANPSWCKKTLPKTYEYVMNCVNRCK